MMYNNNYNLITLFTSSLLLIIIVTNTKAVELIYFLALLARVRNWVLQMVEYCEFISLGIETD